MIPAVNSAVNPAEKSSANAVVNPAIKSGVNPAPALSESCCKVTGQFCCEFCPK